MSRRAAALFVVLLALGAPTPSEAEETATAADTTERGRSLDRILDMTLLPEGRPIEGARTLVYLVDPTSSLQSSAFPAKLEAAVARCADRLGNTKIDVVGVEGKARSDPAPVADASAVVERASALASKPSSAIQNVYAALRRTAADLKRRSGRRDLVLVTLENGDAEDDVEGTVAALRKANVRLYVVARQTFLSDTYWAGRTTGAPPRVDMKGPESAFVELPWGFLFQQGRPNEGVASGFPLYGLSRVAEATGGRVFLYYPPSKTEHRCTHYGHCPFCAGDHVLPEASYQSHRLKALAPLVGSRRDVLAAAARDPYYRAVIRAWEKLSKKGLVASRPSVKRSGASLQLQKNPLGRLADLGSSISFASHATRAGRLLGPLEDVTRELEAAIEKVDGGGSPRCEAIARATVVQLHVTRVNLHLFMAFCRDVGPILAGKKAEDYELPEIPFFHGSERFRGIGWTSMSLCHGVRPYSEIYLPGGESVRRELEALAGVVEPFLERYAHTPFAALVRRSGLARFHLTVRGKYVPPPKRKIPGSESDDATTTPDRPARGGPSTGSGGGPTTGGD